MIKRADEVFPSSVLDHLETTRYSLEGFAASALPPGSLDVMYGALVEYLEHIGATFGVEATFGVIYTDMLRSEAISSDEGDFIAHDQYFGQTINMMNRLFLYDASHATKKIYFHKLAAHALSRYSFYPEAIFAANVYRYSRAQMDHAEKQSAVGSLQHGLYTSIQEMHVLLHEQAHLIFRRHPALLSAVAEDVREWLADFAAPKFGLEQMRAAMQKQGWSKEEEDYFRKTESGFEASRIRLKEECDRISSRDDLIEEFCCDHLAVIHVLGYFSGNRFRVEGEAQARDFNGADRVRAILLCFLNMRTLQTVEAMCSAEKNLDFAERPDRGTSVQEGIYATFYNARLHYAKTLCYDLALDEDDDVEEVHAMVTQMMNSHTDEIFSPAVSTMSRLLYEKGARADIDRLYARLPQNMDEDQWAKRNVSTILAMVSTPGDDEDDGDDGDDEDEVDGDAS